MASKRFVVGLTGGIGCGKSVVAEELGRLGAQIIDTDQICHDLSCLPSPAVEQIAERFGPEFITVNGCMDRAKMRILVFSDPVARKKLEGIFHPLIREEMLRQLAQNKTDTPYSVLVVPLLFEVPSFLELTQYTLVVDCLPEQQVDRVKLRNALSLEQIAAIMATQISREERLRHADAVIQNCGTLAQLHEQTRKFHLSCLQHAKGMQ